jgi:hypothetical protein
MRTMFWSMPLESIAHVAQLTLSMAGMYSQFSWISLLCLRKDIIQPFPSHDTLSLAVSWTGSSTFKRLADCQNCFQFYCLWYSNAKDATSSPSDQRLILCYNYRDIQLSQISMELSKYHSQRLLSWNSTDISSKLWVSTLTCKLCGLNCRVHFFEVCSFPPRVKWICCWELWSYINL